MTANATKERAVATVLQGLAAYYDPAIAVMATLGGYGHERRAWDRLGIPRTSCWFIERNASRARALLRRTRGDGAHHFIGALHDFVRVFRAANPGGTLDMFHWDLSGTVESSASDLQSVIPLVAASAGRCLLVTCADQRVNRALREADLVDAWWQWLLGAERDRAFRAALTREHDAARERKWTNAESANVVTRERSALLHVLLVLAGLRVRDGVVQTGRAYVFGAFDRTRRRMAAGQSPAVARAFSAGEPRIAFLPDAAVRVVYPSRNHAAHRGSRMRTTGMHLERWALPVSLREAAQWVADLMSSTPLQIVVPGSRRLQVRIVRGHQPQPKPKEKEEEVMIESASPSPRERVAADIGEMRALARKVVSALAEEARTLGVTANGQLDAVVAEHDAVAGKLTRVAKRFDGLRAMQAELEEAKAALAGEFGSAGSVASMSDPFADDGQDVLPSDLPMPGTESAGAAEPHHSRRLTKNARKEILRRFVDAAQQGEEALLAEHGVLKSEFGARASRTIASYLRIAKRYGGKGGSAAPALTRKRAKSGQKPTVKPKTALPPEQMDDIRFACTIALAEGKAAYGMACSDLAGKHGGSAAYMDIIARRGRGKFATEFAVRYCARIGRLHHREQAARKLAAALAKHSNPVQLDVQQVLKAAAKQRKVRRA